MSAQKFTLQIFYNKIDAKSYLTLLKKFRIDCELIKYTINKSAAITTWEIVVNKNFIAIAKEFTSWYQDLNARYKDHFLLDFSEEQLQEIIQNPNEWSKNDVKIATKLQYFLNAIAQIREYQKNNKSKKGFAAILRLFQF